MKNDPRLSFLEGHIPHAAGQYIRKHIEERRKRGAEVPAEHEAQDQQDPALKGSTQEEVSEPEVEELDEQGPEESPAPPIMPSERAEHAKYMKGLEHLRSKGNEHEEEKHKKGGKK